MPDIAILDISMPGLTRGWKFWLSPVSRIFLRGWFFSPHLLKAVNWLSAAGGAYSIFLKDAAPEILVQYLRQVADGQRLLPMLSSDQAPRLQAKIAISENALTVWEGSDPIQAARQAAKALLRRDPAAL
jgi:two-component system, NarL family, nitrate/nitrite response regulator NarL